MKHFTRCAKPARDSGRWPTAQSGNGAIDGSSRVYSHKPRVACLMVLMRVQEEDKQ